MNSESSDLKEVDIPSGVRLLILDHINSLVSASGGGLTYSFVSQGLKVKPAHALSWAAWYAFASGTMYKELKEAVIETAYGGLGGAFFGGIGGMVIGPLTRRNPRSIYSLSRTQIGLSIRWWLALSFVTHGLKVRPAHALSYAAVYAVLSRAIYKTYEASLSHVGSSFGLPSPATAAMTHDFLHLGAMITLFRPNLIPPPPTLLLLLIEKVEPNPLSTAPEIEIPMRLGLSIRWWVDILFCEPRLQSKPAHALSWAAWYAFASGTMYKVVYTSPKSLDLLCSNYKLILFLMNSESSDLKEVDIPSGARLLIIDHIKSEWTVQELIESLHTHELRHNDYILPARSHTSTAKAASPADRETTLLKQGLEETVLLGYASVWECFGSFHLLSLSAMTKGRKGENRRLDSSTKQIDENRWFFSSTKRFKSPGSLLDEVKQRIRLRSSAKKRIEANRRWLSSTTKLIVGCSSIESNGKGKGETLEDKGFSFSPMFPNVSAPVSIESLILQIARFLNTENSKRSQFRIN
ncbi:hypothetical protein Bca101_009227 [Brassica carinata]